MVSKCTTVVTFGLAFGLCISKVSTVTGIGGNVVAKCRIVVTFGLAFGEARKERREERGEEREERREERGERRREQDY